MKKVIAILLAVLAFSPLSSGENQEEDAVAVIIGAGDATRSLEADFRQTRRSSLMNGDLVSKGHMSYAKPDKLKWEYTEPDSFAFILDGNRVMTEKDGQLQQGSNAQDKIFRDITKLIMNTVTGTALRNGKDFSVSVETCGRMWIVRLVPARKDLERLLPGMTLHYDRDLKSVVRVEMDEKNGDSTVIEFSDIKRSENE